MREHVLLFSARGTTPRSPRVINPPPRAPPRPCPQVGPVEGLTDATREEVRRRRREMRRAERERRKLQEESDAMLREHMKKKEAFLASKAKVNWRSRRLRPHPPRRILTRLSPFLLLG